MLLNTKGDYTIDIGDCFNGKCGKYQITDIKDNKILVKFLDEFGYKKYVNLCDIRNDNVYNPYIKIIYDIACIGDVPSGYSITQEYHLWIEIINRCYNKNYKEYKDYGDKGVLITARWLCYEYFTLDLPNIKNYDKWKRNTNKWYLNKNIYSNRIGKLYSNKTCVFSKHNFIFEELCSITR